MVLVHSDNPRFLASLAVVATPFLTVGITVFKDRVLLFQVLAAVALPLTAAGLLLLFIVPNEPFCESTTFLRLMLRAVFGFTFVCLTFGFTTLFCIAFGAVIVC
jgi:hypothetical protein